MNIRIDFVWHGEESISLVDRKPGPSDKPAINVCTIMVVEDDPGIQRLIHHALAPQAEVLQDLEGNGERIEQLNFDGVDALILDYKLPGKDGLQILEEVRGAYPSLPILFMTGFGNLDIARRAIASGANEYFPKPFDLKHLRQVLGAWVPNFDPAIGKGSGSIPVLEEGRSLATNVAEEENYLTASDPEGNEISGRVIRYNARAIVIEVGPLFDVSIGTQLKNTVVTLGHRSIEIAGAEVRATTDLAERKWVEIGLPGVWKIDRYKRELDSMAVNEIVRSREPSTLPSYDRLETGMRERELIPDSLSAAVTDFESILEEVKADVEPFEKMMADIDQIERSEIEEKIISYAEGRFFPMLSKSMAKFEAAAAEAERLKIKEPFRNLAQRRLFPMILCSPFISRVIAQPIGVPGDFGILGQLLGHPYQGHNLYSRLLNAWAITAAPSSAYRFRIDLLEEAINGVVAKGESSEEPTRILSMASGVAYEVQRFVTRATPDQKVDFELVDFSNRTLLEAKKHFSECQKAANPSMVDVTLRQGSVIDLAKDTKRKLDETELEQYDLVYCAGLFDYLSERMCSRVVSYLFRLVKPGGKLIVSNYTPENASRFFMGVVMDWELIHRTTSEFEALMDTTLANEDYEIVEDSTRTELYAIANKA